MRALIYLFYSSERLAKSATQGINPTIRTAIFSEYIMQLLVPPNLYWLIEYVESKYPTTSIDKLMRELINFKVSGRKEKDEEEDLIAKNYSCILYL